MSKQKGVERWIAQDVDWLRLRRQLEGNTTVSHRPRRERQMSPGERRRSERQFRHLGRKVNADILEHIFRDQHDIS